MGSDQYLVVYFPFFVVGREMVKDFCWTKSTSPGKRLLVRQGKGKRPISLTLWGGEGEHFRRNWYNFSLFGENRRSLALCILELFEKHWSILFFESDNSFFLQVHY